MASKMLEIKHFQEILSPLLKNNKKVIDYKLEFLNAMGENYGSLLLAVDITIENPDKTTEMLHAVGKLFPPNEWLKQVFRSKLTFPKEIGFYKVIIPELINFQREHFVSEQKVLDIFPQYLNARVSLNPASDLADDDAILLLENLRYSGYKCPNRLVGCNLKEAETILKDLARFHAVPLAYKFQKPDKFSTIILPLLNRVLIGEGMLETAADKYVEVMTRNLNLNESELQKITSGIKRGFQFQKEFPPGNEKYATIVHCDFWLNNAMIQFDNGKPIRQKMIDFQVITYGALATDVVFFLYTSIERGILEKYYDHLLLVYHQSFVECLQDLQCNVSEYTFNDFKNEIEYYGPLEISHMLIMFRVIFRESVTLLEMDNFNEKDLFSDDGIADTYKENMQWALKNFFNKNWL